MYVNTAKWACAAIFKHLQDDSFVECGMKRNYKIADLCFVVGFFLHISVTLLKQRTQDSLYSRLKCPGSHNHSAIMRNWEWGHKGSAAGSDGFGPDGRQCGLDSRGSVDAFKHYCKEAKF